MAVILLRQDDLCFSAVLEEWGLGPDTHLLYMDMLHAIQPVENFSNFDNID